MNTSTGADINVNHQSNGSRHRPIKVFFIFLSGMNWRVKPSNGGLGASAMLLNGDDGWA
jgi:hypothetical protein